MPATIIKCGPLGPYANNAYIIVDEATHGAIFVDAPFGSEAALEAVGDAHVQQIIVTHRHGDHWAEIDVVKAALGVPVYCHEDDRAPYAAKVDGTLEGGEMIALGDTLVRVIHTPGHTPGSICLLVPSVEGNDVLISGDTLFPGGPGRSDSPAALKEMVQSIAARLLVLPDDTQVFPGHGDNTTIAASKREHAVFASKQHPADLCGDVTWE
jgi:glyoxylase-like metal-dependent hydrolase (beta-lactamase superfamily II)